MFRRIVGGFALAAVLATGASAQAFQVGSALTHGFTFDGHAAGPDGGHMYDTYTGNFNIDDSRTGVGTSAFQVFCVDYTHDVQPGESYNAWVTPLSASDFTNTRVAGGEPQLYAEAATLASNMFVGNTNTLAVNQNYEYAMWTILGYTVSTGEENYDAGAIAANITYAQANWGNITLNQWLVITVDPITGPEQEFLYNTTSRPQEATPEPGTMALMATGLVGMAGASFRRRRRNK